MEDNIDLGDLASSHIKELHRIWASVEVDTKTVADSNYQRVDHIAKALISQLPLLTGGRTLDIGCNSGLNSLLAAKHAASVVGSDVKVGYIDRAEAAKKYFHNNLYPVDNVSFVRGNFSDLLTESIDSIIAARVLYHLGDKNIEALGDFLSQGKKRIIIQARPERDIKFKDKPDWYISATKVYNGLYKIGDCLEFLRDCGFSEAKITSMTVVTNKEHFPVIYASRG